MDRKEDISRRGLFEYGLKELGRLAGELIEVAEEVRSFSAQPSRDPDPVYGLLRPPGAVDEKRFMELCHDCDKCMKGCVENILFPAPKNFGDKAGTPIFDPRKRGCFLCTEFHCVTSCPVGALEMPESNKHVRIGTARIDPSLCLAVRGEACSYCFDFCPLTGEAITMMGGIPSIDEGKCTGCGLCDFYCSEKTGANAITTIGRSS